MKKLIIISVFIILFLSRCELQSQNKKLPNGDWATHVDENVSFSTYNENVIRYFEDDSNYNYIINNDSLIIREEKHVITSYFILKISLDSINLKTQEGSILKFYKRL